LNNSEYFQVFPEECVHVAMMPAHLSFDRRRLRIVTIPYAAPPLAALV
jgi:hypothetical protein